MKDAALLRTMIGTPAQPPRTQLEVGTQTSAVDVSALLLAHLGVRVEEDGDGESRAVCVREGCGHCGWRGR